MDSDSSDSGQIEFGFYSDRLLTWVLNGENKPRLEKISSFFSLLNCDCTPLLQMALQGHEAKRHKLATIYESVSMDTHITSNCSKILSTSFLRQQQIVMLR